MHAGAVQWNEDRLAQNPELMFNPYEFQGKTKAAATIELFHSVIMMLVVI